MFTTKSKYRLLLDYPFGKTWIYWYALSSILILLIGFGNIAIFVVAFVIAVEYSGEKFTMFIGIVIAIPFAIGELILGLEAYYIRDWVTLQTVSCVPWVILIPILWFLVPESPRWLIANGR